MGEVKLCQYNKYGFCKFGRTCLNKHVDQKCDAIKCDGKKCSYRHPKICRYYLNFKYCKFGEYCRYDHRKLESEESVKEKKRLIENVNEKDNLIDQLKKELDEKQKQIKALELSLEEKEKEIIKLWDDKGELDLVIYGKEIVIRDLQEKSHDSDNDSDSYDIQYGEETHENEKSTSWTLKM